MASDDYDSIDDQPRRRGRREHVPNYLVNSILVTIFCCLPLGIVAIVHSAKVNSLLANGDIDGAYEASKAAKKWANYAVIAWAVLVVAQLIFVGLAAVTAV